MSYVSAPCGSTQKTCVADGPEQEVHELWRRRRLRATLHKALPVRATPRMQLQTVVIVVFRQTRR